ncbi:MAG: biopolymer transporter ExbD [Kiritimatiellae bacterium]|nr:biopolymer transporter ExbD [Kiritimatiellia bacterium]
MLNRRKDRAKAEIETGSFSDISFLLIIFFVLTTTFEKMSGRAVDIPSAAPPEQQVQKEDKKTPIVNILADRILFGMDKSEGESVSLSELKVRLMKLGLGAKSEKERVVIVEMAEDVNWDRYFKVVTTIAETGGVVAIVEGDE